MRGLTKAAALLSLTFTQAFVVPEPASSGGVGPSEPVVEYHTSKAFLSFDIDHFQRQNPFGDERNFTIEIQSSNKPCGENNVSFLGQELESTWDGTTATGEQYFPGIFPPILASWQIHCLFNSVPSDGSNSKGEDVAHVLSFGISRTRKDLNVGFTVSYKQLGAPTVLQFSPYFIDWNTIKSNTEPWQTPSPALAAPGQSPTIEDTVDDEEDSIEFGRSKQKILFDSVERVTQYLKKQLTSFREAAARIVQSCHTHLKNFGTKVHKTLASLCPEHQHELENENRLNKIFSDSSDNAPLKSSPDRISGGLPPAETRSLHSTTATASPSLPTTISSSSHSTLGSPPTATHFLKLVSVAFLLFSLLTYTFIYIRDPRRRADRAARCEERRNKRLYRRAAWSHWWQTRICALRHRSCPRSRGTGTCETWDEKRARVIRQEEVLEAVAQQDICTLRHATRPKRNINRHVNTMAAAEEGRNDFLYDNDSESDNSERRRRRRQSLCTLPGYESEGTLPPGYTTVVEDTPDSSVVSTSPRISRDGFGTSTDSEDGKSIEDFSLNAVNAPRTVGTAVGRVF